MEIGRFSNTGNRFIIYQFDPMSFVINPKTLKIPKKEIPKKPKERKIRVAKCECGNEYIPGKIRKGCDECIMKNKIAAELFKGIKERVRNGRKALQ